MSKKSKRYDVITACAEPVASLTGDQGSYPVGTFMVPHEGQPYDSIYGTAYTIGKLTLCLYDPQHFMIYVTSLKARLELGQPYTTPIDQVVCGVEYLNSLTDWDAFHSLSQSEKVALIFLVDAAFPTYFGAEFAFFQKHLQRSLQTYFAHMAKWEASTL